MSEHVTEIKKSIQPWIVSLGISVFCCALFFAIMSNYVGKLNETLDKIDARLADIEARTAELRTDPAMPHPVAGQPSANPPMPTLAPPPQPVVVQQQSDNSLLWAAGAGAAG
ncbi:MAG: hypothetical protein K2Q32_04845, partial [Alphaproteobacteria bacterium]|nr:hypothetical protein [Alphaproteobacteria bacterium]